MDLSKAFELIQSKLSDWVRSLIRMLPNIALAVSPTDPTSFYFTGFGDSSINYTIRIWAATPEQPDFLRVRSEVVMNIKKA